MSALPLREPSYEHHPVEDMEPEEPDALSDAYKEASRRMMRVMNISFAWLRSPKHHMVAWWQVQFALGTHMCDGQSMTKISDQLGVTRACISKGATEICRLANIPPSYYMKREAAQLAYQNKRKKQVSNI